MVETPSPRRPVTVADQELAARCARGRVVLIDDDAEIRFIYAALIEWEGYACETFESAAAFLTTLRDKQPRFPGPCCVLSDVSMPDVDGLELQRQLALYRDAPLIFISGSSGIDEAITGFRAGAVDFLIKPVDADVLLAAVAKALALSTERRLARERRAVVIARMALLTEREREVIQRVAQGQANAEIGAALGIVERTVKFHRQNAMENLAVQSVIELVRLVDEAG